jgi:hypothetical protein
MRKLSPWAYVVLVLVLLAFFPGSVELSASPYMQQPQGEEFIPLQTICRAPSGVFSSSFESMPLISLMPGLIQRSERFVEAQIPDITSLLPDVPFEQGAEFLGKIMVKTGPRFL